MDVKNSDRLRYKLLGRDDAQDLFELDQDPEVMKYINGGEPTSMEKIESVFLPRLESYSNNEKGWGMWGVYIAQSDEFIGWILVRPMEFFTDNPEYNNLELGWRFKRSSWGKGYGTEAANAVKDALISYNGQNQTIEYLSAVAMLDNEGSISIMKKMGMSYIKTYVHEDPLGDIDAVYYQLALK